MNLHQQIEQWLVDNKQRFSAADRPYVTLCYAQSWDGSITLRSGMSLPLSGDESSRLTHQLRGLHDGILVGIGTVLADDPRLNVRHYTGPDPQPIILDSQFRMPASARLCSLGGKRCWVLTSAQSKAENAQSQENTDIADNLELHSLPTDSTGRINLHDALKLLRERGINSLMVEGGAEVITAFLKARLVDALIVTVSPTIVGGYKAVGELGYAGKNELPTITPGFSGQLGNDLIMWGNVQYPGLPK